MIGKDCLDLIYKDFLINYRVYHPYLKQCEEKYVIPDGILDNTTTIDVKGKEIYLESDQRLDKLIEFKRNFTSMRKKDWEIYTKLTKELHIYLLKGKREEYKKNGCNVIFHPKEDLIHQLRNVTMPSTKEEALSFIKEINALYRGLDYYKSIFWGSQRRLTDYEIE